MAWEWVAPTATAVSGIVGVIFTWYAGHQGRRHAERVADKSSEHALAKDRETRRAAAYLEILTMVNDMTVGVGKVHGTYNWDGEERPIPDLSEQTAVEAKVRLYASPEALELYMAWLRVARRLLDRRDLHTPLNREDLDKESAEIKEQREMGYQKLNQARRVLAERMHSELTS